MADRAEQTKGSLVAPAHRRRSLRDLGHIARRWGYGYEVASVEKAEAPTDDGRPIAEGVLSAVELPCRCKALRQRPRRKLRQRAHRNRSTIADGHPRDARGHHALPPGLNRMLAWPGPRSRGRGGRLQQARRMLSTRRSFPQSGPAGLSTRYTGRGPTRGSASGHIHHGHQAVGRQRAAPVARQRALRRSCCMTAPGALKVIPIKSQLYSGHM